MTAYDKRIRDLSSDVCSSDPAIHRSNGTAERASAPFAHPVAYRFFCEGEYRHMSAISKSRLLATSAIAGLSILHMVVPALGAEHGRLLPEGEPASVANPAGETIDGELGRAAGRERVWKYV